MSEIPAQKRSPRLSLTKRQLQSTIGVELLSLCQTITQDGRLDETELRLLQGWLDAHQDTSFPSISYMTALVKEVLSKGSFTDGQLCIVYEAIEKILPPDVRETVRAAHQKLEIVQRARLDAERPTSGEVQPDGWTASLDYFDFMIAGVRHENRAAIIADRVTRDTRITLVRDHKNAFSPNAIEIHIETGEQIGFVPEIDARDLAPMLDSGATYETYIKKILSYGRCPIPVVVVKMLTRPEAVTQEVTSSFEQTSGQQAVEKPMQEKRAPAWRRWLGWP